MLRIQDCKTGPRVVYLNAQSMIIIDWQRLIRENNAVFVFPSQVNREKSIGVIDQFW